MCIISHYLSVENTLSSVRDSLPTYSKHLLITACCATPWRSIYFSATEVYPHADACTRAGTGTGRGFTHVYARSRVRSASRYKSLENTPVSCSSHLTAWNTVMVEMTFKVECRNASKEGKVTRRAEKVLFKEQLEKENKRKDEKAEGGEGGSSDILNAKRRIRSGERRILNQASNYKRIIGTTCEREGSYEINNSKWGNRKRESSSRLGLSGS